MTVTLEEPLAWEDRDYALRTVHEKPASVTHKLMWDCVDQAWAGPFPAARIYDQYLQKQVVICSACNYMSNRGNGDIRKHVELVKEQAAMHADAVITAISVDERGSAYQICSGCGQRLQVGSDHINRMNSSALGHDYVEALFMNKFALTRSEPVILGREVIVDGPVTSQVAQIASPRKRSRRRRKKHDDRD